VLLAVEPHPRRFRNIPGMSGTKPVGAEPRNDIGIGRKLESGEAVEPEVLGKNHVVASESERRVAGCEREKSSMRLDEIHAACGKLVVRDAGQSFEVFRKRGIQPRLDQAFEFAGLPEALRVEANRAYLHDFTKLARLQPALRHRALPGREFQIEDDDARS